MSDAKRLEKLVKKAYTNRETLEYLERNHMFHWRKVILKIINKHYGGKK